MITANLGHTVFELDEDNPRGDIVCVVRKNSDGEKRFYVPRELFEQYAERRAHEVVQAAFKK